MPPKPLGALKGFHIWPVNHLSQIYIYIYSHFYTVYKICLPQPINSHWPNEMIADYSIYDSIFHCLGLAHRHYYYMYIELMVEEKYRTAAELQYC